MGRLFAEGRRKRRRRKGAHGYHKCTITEIRINARVMNRVTVHVNVYLHRWLGRCLCKLKWKDGDLFKPLKK